MIILTQCFLISLNYCYLRKVRVFLRTYLTTYVKNAGRTSLLGISTFRFLTANGVSSIFSSFEGSYHVELSRSFIRQYLYSMMVGILLALLLLVGVMALCFRNFILSNLDELIPSEINWIRIGQLFFYAILIYITVAILYYFGTIGVKRHAFLPRCFDDCLLILLTTYLFSVY